MNAGVAEDGSLKEAGPAADPAGADAYRANAAAYLARLDALDREIREAVAKIPPDWMARMAKGVPGISS